MTALSGEKTLAELSAEFGVHPTMISDWKQELVKRAGELFARGNRAPAVGDAQKVIDDLHRKIGQLQVLNHDSRFVRNASEMHEIPRAARKPHCPRRVRICAPLVADEVEALLLNTRTTQHSLPISKVGLVKLIADRCRGC